MSTSLAARIAVREVRRRPFRSLLVVALVAIPVLGMTVATTLIRTEDRTPLEEWDGRWGGADLVAFLAPDEAGAVADLRDRLPAGSRTSELTTAWVPVRDADTRSVARFTTGDLADPLLARRFPVLDGRLPERGLEVAVNRATADRFGLRVGSTFGLERPVPVAFDVVGVVRDRSCVRCDLVVVAGDLPAGSPGLERTVLVDLPGTPPPAELLAAQAGWNEGPAAQSTGFVEVRPVAGVGIADVRHAGSAIRWSTVVGALALAVVGIVIAAAFSVGARRQLVLLGQLGANGAPESLLRRILVLQGTATGVIGAAVGVAGGLAAVHAGQGTVERFLDRHLTGYDVGATELVVAALIGVVGATLAALVPARSAARVSTLHALAGRRPLEAVRRALTAGGLAAVVCGLGVLAVATVGARSGVSGDLWAAVAIAGGLGVLFGATALTPAIVQRLEPLAGRARGSLRLATRSLARNRTRTGAVIAAVAAAGALAIGGTTAARAVTGGSELTRLAPGTAVLFVPGGLAGAAGTTGGASTVADEDVAAFAAAVPDATLHRPAVVDVTVSSPLGGGGPDDVVLVSSSMLVVDDALAEGVRLSGPARRALRDEGIVVVGALVDDDGPRTQELDLGSGRTVTAPFRSSRHSLADLDVGAYVTPSYAATLGAPLRPGPVVATAPDGFSEAELFDLQELATGLSLATGGTSADATVRFGFERSGLDQRGLELLLAAVSVLFALVVVGIGLALAAADEKDERELLVVVGAGPDVVSRVAGAKAWVLATLGAALAVPVGFLPAATVVGVSQTGRALHFPATVAVVLLVVAPLLAAAAAFATSSAARRLRPMRVSSATFD